MKLCHVSIAGLIISAIACGIVTFLRTSDPLTLLAVYVQPSVVALPMVWYMGRRQSETDPLNILAFVLSLGISVFWALAEAAQGGSLHEMGDLVALGLCAIALLVMPILCLVAFFTARHSSPEPRGFPVLPVTEKKKTGGEIGGGRN